MAQLRIALSVLFALGAATLPALAQIRSEAPVTEEGGKLFLDALGHHLALPRPDWLTGEEAVLGRVETSFVAEPLALRVGFLYAPCINYRVKR